LESFLLYRTIVRVTNILEDPNVWPFFDSAAFVLLACHTAAAQHLDLDAPSLVLLDGKVLTMDEQSRMAEALAIRDGKILAVGTTSMIRTMAGSQASVIDLGGKTARRAP
jgi:hypothetical protein